MGQLVSTPLEALPLEADVQSYRNCINYLILKARKKALCSFNEHPKGIALAFSIPHGLQNCSSLHQKLKNFPHSCHPILNTDKTFIFHLHHHSIVPPMKDELPPLFQESLVELTTPTKKTDAVSPPLLRIRLITSYILMDPLVEGQGTGM